MVNLSDNQKYIVTQATKNDVPAIMEIELSSFKQGIAESKETFIDRLSIFPEGFFVLKPSGNSDTHSKIQATGYLCSELWESIPKPEALSYQLNHTASSKHTANGTVLYISSFAIQPTTRGGTGRFFFQCLS